LSKGEPDRVLDQYLVTLSQAGSRDAFERLARRWTPRLLRFATRTVGQSELGRDIVQETWVGAIRGLKALVDPSSFPAWIYGIAHRKCIDAIRVRQRSRSLSDQVQREVDAAISVNPTHSAPSESLDLATAIANLNDEQRIVVTLFYGEDLSVVEIAEILSVPAGTVKSRLFHARDILKKLLGE
jgi:RNA polymerase sigma-70 factor (ECF subfamily)